MLVAKKEQKIASAVAKMVEGAFSALLRNQMVIEQRLARIEVMLNPKQEEKTDE